jgi:hypothetical protein
MGGNHDTKIATFNLLNSGKLGGSFHVHGFLARPLLAFPCITNDFPLPNHLDRARAALMQRDGTMRRPRSRRARERAPPLPGGGAAPRPARAAALFHSFSLFASSRMRDADARSARGARTPHPEAPHAALTPPGSRTMRRSLRPPRAALLSLAALLAALSVRSAAAATACCCGFAGAGCTSPLAITALSGLTGSTTGSTSVSGKD